MKTIVVCGDSYAIGIGCLDLRNEPFGSLLSKKLDRKLINYGKGSSTNLSIFLQVKYAIEHIDDIDFVCVSTTSYNRVEWFSGTSTPKQWDNLTNEDVIYDGYGPYVPGTYDGQVENPMKGTKGTMLTENYYGIIDYVDNFLDTPNKNIPYFHKFDKESPEKMRLLKQYYLDVFDVGIQRLYDIGMVCLSHQLLEKNGIKHYILSPDKDLLTYIPDKNYIHIDWGKLSLDYPDEIKSLHTSAEGHYKVYQDVLFKHTGEYDSEPYIKNPYLYWENLRIRDRRKLI